MTMFTSDEIIAQLRAEIGKLEFSVRLKNAIINSTGLDLKCKEFEDNISTGDQNTQEKSLVIEQLQAKNSELEEAF